MRPCANSSFPDFLCVQRHQADLLSALQKQMKEISTKEAAKVQAEQEQPVLLTGMKMIGGPAYVYTPPISNQAHHPFRAATLFSNRRPGSQEDSIRLQLRPVFRMFWKCLRARQGGSQRRESAST